MAVHTVASCQAVVTETMPGKTAPVNPKLAQVPTVQIDASGTFKYILCKIYEGNNTSDYKYIVRGTADANFHADIYDYLDANLEAEGISCECVGGGKITHDPENKSITIFGKSQCPLVKRNWHQDEGASHPVAGRT
ncbi:14 kDa phosphohistidine phosphatase-like isoform X4 [Pomacea canaliculata]|uniref:14 kDa phosphohistidine phosphatase-like isoform X4 n=1 Tax=Pomacea canaliculata TaxID=400727 RepID=UPI000D7310A7|nr:14 kDa phosphohistidine phosphatase-like isoform X4 [Pomacea canaliculata]